MKTKTQVQPDYSGNFSVPDHPIYKSPKGLSRQIVEEISHQKKEPAWMLEFRLKALKVFESKPMPKWGPDLSGIDFGNIHYYLRTTDKPVRSWEEVPEEVKTTFDRLGIPEAERKFLAGAGAQFDSEAVYHNLNETLAKQGVIFVDMDTAVREHPELVRKYFGTVIPSVDNKFAALNSAVWSGGSFIYVPKGVHVELPLQAYFRINARNMGQFERTLIIADEGSSVHYVEGCFTKGALISTNPLYKPIEEIRVGDQVLTHTGQYKTVYNLMQHLYSGELYNISYYGDSTSLMEVTSEHPILCVKRKLSNERNKKWEVAWTTPSQLSMGDYLAMPIPKQVVSIETFSMSVPFRAAEEIIKIPSTPDFFRLAGYFLAEGSTDPKGYVHLSFSDKEEQFLKDAQQLFNSVFGVTKFNIIPYEKNHGISLVVCNVKLARVFRELFGESAAGRKIPQWMMVERKSKQRELIKGFFRGDGNYYLRQNPNGLKELFRLNTISERLARQLRDLLLRQGVVAFINKQSNRGVGRKPIFTVGIGGEQAVYFGELVDMVIPHRMHNKKRATMFNIDHKYAYFPIRKINHKTVKDVPVYNFSVEGDESYVAQGVAVHNCTAPTYTSDSLHSAVVEILVRPHANVQYTTIQNWSKNVYNLVTKRAVAQQGAQMFWLDCNLGSKVTMKYPSVFLTGEGAKGKVLSLALANDGQHQDAGSKMIHAAPNTTSTVISKSISKGSGRTSYRGLVKVLPNAVGAKSHVKCDALLINQASRSDTYPTLDVHEDDAEVAHEATVTKIGEEQLFYLMSRGLSEAEANSLLVNGFLKDIVMTLPMEYAIEMNRLVELEMEGAVG